jgi:hypothetical protein
MEIEISPSKINLTVQTYEMSQIITEAEFYVEPMGQDPQYRYQTGESLRMTKMPFHLTEQLRWCVDGLKTVRCGNYEQKTVGMACRLTPTEMNEPNWQKTWGHFIGWCTFYLCRNGSEKNSEIDIMMQTNDEDGAVFRVIMVL